MTLTLDGRTYRTRPLGPAEALLLGQLVRESALRTGLRAEDTAGGPLRDEAVAAEAGRVILCDLCAHSARQLGELLVMFLGVGAGEIVVLAGDALVEAVSEMLGATRPPRIAELRALMGVS